MSKKRKATLTIGGKEIEVTDFQIHMTKPEPNDPPIQFGGEVSGEIEFKIPAWTYYRLVGVAAPEIIRSIIESN